jgi:hypothetical protein
MTTLDIEIAVMRFFGIRRNLIVPNISWGMGLHECDLLILSKSGYASEVEIKISRSDLLADLKKEHHHESRMLRRLFYAIPENLLSSIDRLPERAGILVANSEYPWCRLLRPAKNNRDARQLTPDEVYQLARLGCLRILPLKETVQTLLEEKKH